MSVRVNYIKSAGRKEDYPLDKRPEVAVVGRSNAGKSSLINAIANKEIAHISKKPGKTNCLNFYLVNDKFYFVDMPGYGFAHKSKSEMDSWKGMIEGYLVNRKNLVALMLVTDIKREWKAEEDMLLNLCKSRELPLVAILNKMDKVGQGDRIKKMREYKAIEGLNEAFCVSSTQKKGVDSLVDFLFTNWGSE